MLASKMAKSSNSAPTKGYNGTNIYAKKRIHHKKRFTRTGKFPFFGLPREIRDIIYENVLETPIGDNTITPDPAHTRRTNSGHEESLKQRTLSNVLGLLLFCRKAHEEAMEALYGNHVFYFDDTRHGRYETEVEASAHCYYCRADFAGDCFSSSRGRHYVCVPYCDFVGMHDWLINIGEENRMRIRHVQLHFSGAQFVKFLGESHWVSVLEPGSPRKPSPVGGDFIARALKLLGSAHNLETFRISFNYPSYDDTSYEYQCDISNQRRWAKHAFQLLFQPENPKNLKTILCGIAGVRRLLCQEIGNVEMSTANDIDSRLTDAARAGLRQVREAMELGHPSRLRPGEVLAYYQSPISSKWTNRWKVSNPWPEAYMRRV